MREWEHPSIMKKFHRLKSNGKEAYPLRNNY